MDFMNEHENEKDINTLSYELKQAKKRKRLERRKEKKQLEKYIFTISSGCMLKIWLLLVGNFILFLIKLYIYITYC